MYPLLIAANLLLAGFMTGLIWFVQIVHYPLFAGVGAEAFPAYQRLHERLTTFVVAPAMLAELAVAAALVVLAPPAHRGLAITAAGLLLLTWLSTFLVQVPFHQQLEAGFDPQVHGKLVATNWVRTAAWSGRALIAVAMLMTQHPATRA